MRKNSTAGQPTDMLHAHSMLDTHTHNV